MNEPIVARTVGQPLAGRSNPGAPTRRPLFITIAGAALLLAAAFFAGWASANAGGANSGQPAATTQAPAGAFLGLPDSTTPYDVRFIDAMIPHHAGAIISVQAMITNSTHPELRDLGHRIVQVQQQQIAQMLAWRAQWYPNAAPLNLASMDMGMDMMSGGMLGGWMMGSGVLTATQSVAPYRGMMGPGMMGNPGTAPQGNTNGTGIMSGDQADRMFLRMMIPHHQVAIDLAQDALQNAQHPELKPLSQSIISGQSAEIVEMEGDLKTWYNEASTRTLAAPMEQMMRGLGH